jgi:hypothetical protein
MKKTVKKLTPRDVVLGIGRKATDEELSEYLNRPLKEEFKPIAQVREEITAHLRKPNQSGC